MLVFIFRVSASKLILVVLASRVLSLNEVPYMLIIPVNWFGAMLEIGSPSLNSAFSDFPIPNDYPSSNLIASTAPNTIPENDSN